MTTEENRKSSPMQCEGNYEAARNFDRAEQAFVKSGAVAKNARKAADTLDDPEAEEFEAAKMSS